MLLLAQLGYKIASYKLSKLTTPCDGLDIKRAGGSVARRVGEAVLHIDGHAESDEDAGARVRGKFQVGRSGVVGGRGRGPGHLGVSGTARDLLDDVVGATGDDGSSHVHGASC